MTAYTATGPHGATIDIPAAMSADDARRIATEALGVAPWQVKVWLKPAAPEPHYIIEICPHEPRATICTMSGESCADDPDIADCRASGDCEPACTYVRDELGVEFRIIARNAAGQYENRLATDDEIRATTRALYFDEIPAHFDPVERCEIYLIWQAAADAEHESD